MILFYSIINLYNQSLTTSYYTSSTIRLFRGGGAKPKTNTHTAKKKTQTHHSPKKTATPHFPSLTLQTLLGVCSERLGDRYSCVCRFRCQTTKWLYSKKTFQG